MPACKAARRSVYEGSNPGRSTGCKATQAFNRSSPVMMIALPLNSFLHLNVSTSIPYRPLNTNSVANPASTPFAASSVCASAPTKRLASSPVAPPPMMIFNLVSQPCILQGLHYLLHRRIGRSQQSRHPDNLRALPFLRLRETCRQEHRYPDRQLRIRRLAPSP